MTERMHPITVDGYTGDLQELGVKIMRLRFDALLLVVYGMYLEANRQMQEDSARGRIQLARGLSDVYIHLGWSRRYLQNVWRIAKPKMADELAKTPEIRGGQIAA